MRHRTSETQCWEPKASGAQGLVSGAQSTASGTQSLVSQAQICSSNGTELSHAESWELTLCSDRRNPALSATRRKQLQPPRLDFSSSAPEADDSTVIHKPPCDSRLKIAPCARLTRRAIHAHADGTPGYRPSITAGSLRVPGLNLADQRPAVTGQEAVLLPSSGAESSTAIYFHSPVLRPRRSSTPAAAAGNGGTARVSRFQGAMRPCGRERRKATERRSTGRARHRPHPLALRPGSAGPSPAAEDRRRRAGSSRPNRR